MKADITGWIWGGGFGDTHHSGVGGFGDRVDLGTRTIPGGFGDTHHSGVDLGVDLGGGFGVDLGTRTIPG